MDFEPKRFYRKFRMLLEGIAAVPAKELLQRVLHEVVNNFGEDLGITSGRLYTEEPEGFRLVLDCGSRDATVKGLLLPAKYPPIELLQQYNVFIFNSQIPGIDPALEERLGGLDSASLMLSSRPRAVLAFGLVQNYHRERLDFGLQAIHSALSQRLRWDSIESSMRQALEIQQSLLPKTKPVFPDYDISAMSQAAEVVGGDFFDFQVLGDDTLGIAIGDASGHGLPAALQARDVVIGLRMGIERQMKMAPTIQKLNRVICQSTVSSRFVSLFYGELEQNGNFFYINAGHPPAILVSDARTQILTVGGPILGPLIEVQYKRGFVHLDRGCTLVLYTDGITEAKNETGEEFGEERLLQLIKARDPRTARQILQDILANVAKFSGSPDFVDDATLVVIQREA